LRVDREKAGEIARGARVTGGLFIGGSALAVCVGVVGLATTLIAVLGSHGDHSLAVQAVSGFCLGVAGVLLPVLAAAASIVLSVRAFRRAGAFEALLASVLRDGTLDRPGLETRLGRERTEGVIADATKNGALLPDTSTAPPSPVIAMPASPRVVIPESAYTPRLAETMLGLAATSLAPSQRPPPMPSDMPDTRSPGVARTPEPKTTPGAPAVDLAGRTLKGTWEVERRLASGGMGTVYVARHSRTGRRYALKSLLPTVQLSSVAIARFEREARAATAIGHAGIAAVHDFDVTPEGLHYLVMDLLVGESLEDRLARVGRLPWPEAKRVTLEVADALAAAHRAGVLHRDVKPSNVFMASREGAAERAMLVDFGLAKPIVPGQGSSVTRTGAIVGTAHYMAPEQARSGPVDERTDVYGLGATLYEMLAGVPPFLGSSPFAVMAMLLEETPVAPSALSGNVPPAVDALVLRALAKQPNDRWPSIPALRAALEATP
jgi:serine/threonine-protein kinase